MSSRDMLVLATAPNLGSQAYKTLYSLFLLMWVLGNLSSGPGAYAANTLSIELPSS